MKFEAFAERARVIEGTDPDLEVVSLTADLLARGDEDLAVVTRFVQGRVFPAWSSRTLDVGPTLCYEALARAAPPNVDVAEVEERLAERGDVGDVAASLDLGGQSDLGAFADAGPDDSTVGEVFDRLEDVASAAGPGSTDRKLDVLFGLFSSCSSDEARYLARLVLGEMRIGVGEGTVRDAIAEAFDVPVESVGRALQVTNDYGLVAERARTEGTPGLDDLGLAVGRPVQAMLAQVGTVTDAVADWGRAVVETKFDGARVQVHYDAEDGVSLYSRNMEEVTGALPELVEFVEANCTAPAILDGEVVAIDEDGRALPFQEVLRRFRRKHDVDAAREDVGTRLHVFDCLHAPAAVAEDLPPPDPALVDTTVDSTPDDSPGDGRSGDGAESSPDQAGLSDWTDDDPDQTNPADPGEPSERRPDGAAPNDGGVDLLDVPLERRREYLEAVVDAAGSSGDAPDPSDGGVVPATITDDVDAIEAVETEALEAGHEGIMLKNPASAYTPGRRGRDWRKRKPDVETLDLVVTGAEWGEGRRAELFGTYQLSARTDDGYAPVGNVATGMTDEDLEELHDLLGSHVRSEDGQTIDVEPAVVFEVGYEEIQRSPTYSSGYALRFPRFVTVREDLDPDDADTLERVERLADAQ